MIYLNLFLHFFYIGLFSFGGGYATLPFLYHLAEIKQWFTVQQLSDMIAIASITPGPVGINVATFAGFTTTGILGALIATTSIILPSFILILIISGILEQYKTNKYVQSVIYVLKPVGCGLLASVGINMFIQKINLIAIIFLLVLYLISRYKKLDPLFYLGISAIFGMVAGIFKVIS